MLSVKNPYMVMRWGSRNVLYLNGLYKAYKVLLAILTFGVKHCTAGLSGMWEAVDEQPEVGFTLEIKLELFR